jgi:uncharacterized membrane protein (UPF0127 family)
MELKKRKIGLDKIKKIPELRKIKTVGQEARGLMFRSKNKARALLFEFDRPVNLKIHSWFVSFPFVAIWFDKNNKFIAKRVIRPWRLPLGPGKPFTKLIEVPINDFYRREINDLLKLD